MSVTVLKVMLFEGNASLSSGTNIKKEGRIPLRRSQISKISISASHLSLYGAAIPCAPRHEDRLVSGGIAPCILNLGRSWRWVVSFRPKRVYSGNPLDARQSAPEQGRTPCCSGFSAIQTVACRSTREEHRLSVFENGADENICTQDLWNSWRLQTFA
jgi:hypothetical protein